MSARTPRVWVLAWEDRAYMDGPTPGVGVLTVRKEQRARGGGYWTAYRRVGHRVRKAYLGRASAVTQARLSALTCTFLAPLADGETD